MEKVDIRVGDLVKVVDIHIADYFYKNRDHAGRSMYGVIGRVTEGAYGQTPILIAESWDDGWVRSVPIKFVDFATGSICCTFFYRVKLELLERAE